MALDLVVCDESPLYQEGELGAYGLFDVVPTAFSYAVTVTVVVFCINREPYGS
jgi:hypothetical protein